MARNLGSFATPSNNFMCEPIAQPEVEAAKYEIKSKYHGSKGPIWRLCF